jgi:hypothetical protein
MLVRQAAKDILSGGTLTAIARQWNQAGVTSTRGAKWDVPRVKRMLVNPRYAGLRTYHGKVIGPGAWEALLDPDTHAGVVAILSDPSRGKRDVSWERRYIGSHRYLCGRCGATMLHKISKVQGKTVHRYACTAAHHLARSQPDVDAVVEAVALEFLRDQKNLHKFLAAKKDGDIDPGELRARRDALRAQRDELATLFADGVLDGAAVRRESAKLSQKIGVIDTALADLARRSPLAELLSEGADKLDERWAAASPDIKGKCLDELFTVRVEPAPSKGGRFNPDLITFDWKHKR